jgi:hypothetical protein
MVMNKQSTALALLFLGASASVAWAGDPRTDQLLVRSAKVSGADWLALPASMDEQTKEDLLARAASLRFDRRTWKRDLETLMLAEVASGRDDLSRVEHLAGLEPQIYLKNRRPSPAVGAELRMMKLSPGALYVTYLKTFAVYPYVGRSQYPVSLGDEAFAAIRLKEQEALRQGLLVAIGASGHPAAGHLLAEVMLDPAIDEGTRGLAAVHLGEAGGELAEQKLTAMLGDDGNTELLRASALAGLGQIRTTSSLATINGTLTKTKSIGLKKAAIAALGNLGSGWALEAEGRADATTLRTRIAARLVDVLLSKDGAELEAQTLEALTRAGDAAALERLRAADGLDEATAARAGRAASRIARALERR